MSAQPEALRIADECEQSGIEWRAEVHTRLQAAAELRRLHSESEAMLVGLRNRDDWLEQKSKRLIAFAALLRQALEALETDAWQKKLMAANVIRQHMEGKA